MVFEILTGLPGTGPWPEQFSATGLGTHSEGFVVRFIPDHGAAWIGNFQPGLTPWQGAYAHPNGRHVLVVSGGQGYVIDPETRRLESLADAAIAWISWIPSRQVLLIDNQGLDFEAIGANGREWRTHRISWDGFQHITIEGTEMRGEAWNAIDQRWEPFRVDLQTGLAEGGGYHWNLEGDR
jgi:hypothetical protein